jgi:hypothetical protein
VFGALPAKLEGGCFPQFDRENENVRLIPMDQEYVYKNYSEFYCGVDHGHVDATVFTLIGIDRPYGNPPRLGIISRYYHKNHVTEDEYGNKKVKIATDFAEDFYEWATDAYELISKKHFTTNFESARPDVAEAFERYMAVQSSRAPTAIRLVNKQARGQDRTDAVQERIDI